MTPTALDTTIAQYLELGYRLDTRTEQQAVFISGHRPNHILHLILTIVTLGLWLIPWIIISISGGERRIIFTLQPDGSVRETRARG